MPCLILAALLLPQQCIDELIIDVVDCARLFTAKCGGQPNRPEMRASGLHCCDGAVTRYTNGAFSVDMPRGCVTVMHEGGYAANGIKHCVRPMDMTGLAAPPTAAQP